MANFVSDQNCKEFFQYVCDALDDVVRIAKEQKKEIMDTFVNTDEPYANDDDYAINLDAMLQHYLNRVSFVLEEIESDVIDERDA